MVALGYKSLGQHASQRIVRTGNKVLLNVIAKHNINKTRDKLIPGFLFKKDELIQNYLFLWITKST